MEDYVPEPTVVPCRPFDAAADAAALRAAMKGMGTDEEPIIEILSQRSSKQRQEIAAFYKTEFGRDLSDDLKCELGGKFEDVVVALMLTIPEYLAKQLHKAVNNLGTDEEAIVEILCSRTNHEVRDIADAYQQRYETSLEDDLKGDTSGHFRRLVTMIVTEARQEWGPVSEEKAKCDAEVLYNSGEGMAGTDEAAFNAILGHQNPRQLRLLFKEYAELAGRTIEEAIEEEMSGSLKKGLLAIVDSTQNRPSYFAKRLNDAMCGAGTDDPTLIRVIVSRSEIDLGNIKHEYEKLYDRTLASAVSDEVSGDYKNALLALIG